MIVRYFLSLLGAIAMASFTTAIAFDAAMRDRAPAQALGAWPADGLARANFARDLFRAQTARRPDPASAVPDAAMIELSKQALVTEPLASEAVFLLAVGTKDPDRRLALLEAAAKMDRRSALTQSRLLAEYAQRGRNADVIRTIDRMMKVHPELQGVYSHALGQALADPDSYNVVAQVLRADPALANRVLRDASYSDDTIKAAVRVRRSSPQLPLADLDTDRAFLSGLLRINDFDETFALFDRLNQGKLARLNGTTDGADTGSYPPVDWVFTESSRLSAQQVADQSLTVHIGGGDGGVLGRRLIALPPGGYQARGKVTPTAPDEGPSAFRLHLSCAEPNAGTNRIEVSLDDSDPAASRFMVPKGLCRYFWVELYGTASRSPNGIDAVIRDLVLIGIGGQRPVPIVRLS